MNEAGGSGADELRALLRARTHAAIDVARRTGGEVSSADLVALESLARLVDLADKASPRTPPRRSWTFAAVFAATLGVLSILLFARVRQTAIELDAEASQVSFVLPSEQLLFENVELSTLGASGLSRLVLPTMAATHLGSAPSLQNDQAVRLHAETDGSRRGIISIAEVKPKERTQVDLRLTGNTGQYRLTLRDSKFPIVVGVVGPITVAVAGVGTKRIDFEAPEAIVLEPDASVDLDLTFRDPERAATTPQVPLSNLAFWRVDEFGDRRLSVFRTLSTLLDGTLYFASLGGVTRQIRSGEILRFAESEGEIRTVRLKSDRISLSFQGNVRGMTTGDEPDRRSLMPTWLEWLRAQHGLSLLWGTSLYAAGIAMAVFRWFKGSP